MALCDDRHRVWVVSLDSYFARVSARDASRGAKETTPKNLDWELLKAGPCEALA